MKDADRDFWLSSQESVSYGLIDSIITNKIVKSKGKN
jgi:ATP-dependent protease ClpP protease subunit